MEHGKAHDGEPARGRSSTSGARSLALLISAGMLLPSPARAQARAAETELSWVAPSGDEKPGSGKKTGTKPGTKSGTKFGKKSGKKSGAKSGKKPGTKPGKKPAKAPDTKPDEEPTTDAAEGEPELDDDDDDAPGEVGERLQTLFEDATKARDEGDLGRAADLFEEAYNSIPSEQHEARASVLFLLIDVLRSAATVEDKPGYLCEAERKLLVFLEEIRRDFGAKGDEFRDVDKAKSLLVEIRELLETAVKEHPELDCDDPWAEKPADEPDDSAAREAEAARARAAEREAAKRRRLLIAGATTTGLGVAALGLMTAGLVIGSFAERDGQARVDAALEMGAPLPEDDPTLVELDGRGRTANILAIVGGVVGGLALGAGVPLLVLGAKKPTERSVTLRPQLSRRGVGASLTLRF